MADQPTYLCGACSRLMCETCKSIADEYEYLLKVRTQALITAENHLEEKQRELETMKRRADMFEQISKAGLPDVIRAWMDKEIERLLKVPA